MKTRKSTRMRIFLVVSMATAIVMTTVCTAFEEVRLGQNPNPGQTDEWPFPTDFEFNWGDLAFEREETRHELVIIKDEDYPSRRLVECRGENITSLSAISCESMDVCEEKKACLLDKTKCSLRQKVKYGRKCTVTEDGASSYGSSDSRIRTILYDDDNNNEPPASGSLPSCFKVDLFVNDGHSGIVQCTSKEAGVNVTTFDHYIITTFNSTFLSTMKNVTSALINMKLYVSSLTEDLNYNNTMKERNVTLYVDEMVTSFECLVPKLIFHKDGLIIRVYRKDGSTVKLGADMTSISPSKAFLRAELTNFRVPADMIAFSCSAQRTSSSGEWLENRINVTVLDPPSEVVVKSSECSNMTVNLTSGSKVNLHCELTGPSKLKTSAAHRMREMANNYYYYEKEAKSSSMVEFLRFYQVAGDHMICNESSPNYSSQVESNWTIEHEKYYGEEQQFHFIFNLAPSAPKIYKSPTLIHLIYHKDHIVDQTLICLFGGEPTPRITWMKNGNEILPADSVETHQSPSEDLEQDFVTRNETDFPLPMPFGSDRFRLGAKTIEPADFKLDENGNGAHVNFSCIAQNHFGSDRLDFIVIKSDEFTQHFEKSDPTLAATTKTAQTMPSTPKTTKNTKRPSVSSPSTTKKSTKISTFNPLRKAGNSNAESNSTHSKNVNVPENLRNGKSKTSSKTLVFVTMFFVLAFILLLVFFLFWKQRAARAAADSDFDFDASGSGRILRFENRSSNNPDESMRNILIDDD